MAISIWCARKMYMPQCVLVILLVILMFIYRVSLILSPFTTFYKQLTCPDYNATTDVYAPMFACDFIGFLIVVFGYWAFGPSVSNFLAKRKVINHAAKLHPYGQYMQVTGCL